MISSILDAAIGVSFVLALLSLVASAINELIAALLRRRAANLAAGIERLVGLEFAKELNASPLMPRSVTGAPSYIAPRAFVAAFIDTLARLGKLAGETDGDTPLDRLVRALVDEAAREKKDLAAAVERWFNDAMERVSGLYKRNTQFVLVLIGFVLSVACNVDCIEVLRRLVIDASKRAAVVQFANQWKTSGDPAKDALAALGVLDEIGYPVGWWAGARLCDQGALGAIRILSGWLLTAICVSLGAPFWFDLLGRFIVIRSTVKPFEKGGTEPPK